MIAIGKQLRSRGYDVVISLAEPYAPLAEQAGLRAEPVISHEKFAQAIGNAAVWNPIRGPLQVFQVMVKDFLESHEQVIHRHHVPGRTVLVAHPLDLASRIVRDADPSTPLISVHVQPVTLRTLSQPPRLSPWWFEISRPRWAIRAGYSAIDHLIIDPILRGPINRMRHRYGLPPVRRIMDRWWLSPDCILAMFPSWYAPATVGFHDQLTHCGFPRDDVDGDDFELPTNRPIVFTAGTAHRHCRAFFERAVTACEQLRRPGLLLSTFSENFPDPGSLPPSIRTMSYASLRRLLPVCAAIVHHGGIGTTSQAMAAGIPQVICPLAFDQFDNATRVERLRCGRWLHHPSRLAPTLADCLADSDRVSSKVLDELAERLRGGGGAVAAADRIEQVVACRCT
jgi:rhamnosyltransferase subunit B